MGFCITCHFFSFNGFTTIFITKLQIFLLVTCQDLLHSMPGLFTYMDKTFCIPCQDFVHPLPGLLRPLCIITTKQLPLNSILSSKIDCESNFQIKKMYFME